MKKARQAIKCYGGKFYLYKWIISNFPDGFESMTYVEPYCGYANIFFNKPNSKIEIINDIDNGIVQIYRALRNEPSEFIRRLKICKYYEENVQKTLKKNIIEDYLEHAVNEFIIRKMNCNEFSKNFTFSNRKKNDKNSWKESLNDLSPLSKRLKEVFVLNKPSIEIIKYFNSKNTLLYIDQKYLQKNELKKDNCTFEMSEESHIDLANTLKKFTGKVIISGYNSPFYNKIYKGWKICNYNNEKKNNKEIIWKNFDK